MIFGLTGNALPEDINFFKEHVSFIEMLSLWHNYMIFTIINTV